MSADYDMNVSPARTVLGKVGQFLDARNAGAGESGLEPIVDELEPCYEQALAYLARHQQDDPAFLCVAGMAAYALAVYYVEYHYVRDDAEKYANAGRTYLKAYLDRFGSSIGEAERSSTRSSYFQCCEYAAYIAYYKDEYSSVISLMSDVPLATTSLALAGTAMALLADSLDSPDTARAALSLLEKMDGAIRGPANRDYVEDVYRNAYTFYALMLATNADRYPGAGFQNDLPRAIAVLNRGISLIRDEQYIAWLQADIEKYRSRM